MVGEDKTFLVDDGSGTHTFLSKWLPRLLFRRFDAGEKAFKKFFVVKIVWIVERLSLRITEDFFYFDVDYCLLDILNQSSPGFGFPDQLFQILFVLRVDGDVPDKNE